MNTDSLFNRRSFVLMGAVAATSCIVGAAGDKMAVANEIEMSESDLRGTADENYAELFTDVYKKIDSMTERLLKPNSLNRLVLLDSYDSIDAIHPKVLKFEKKWNGYYWWMAFTPYPNSDQSCENPHILASNNMTTWREPSGYKNPLEPQPGNDSKKYYNSDTHLVFRDDLNQLECWWRYVDDVSDVVEVRRRVTDDGVNWTSSETMLAWKRSERDCVCPVLIYEEGKYKCWYVNRDNSLNYMESYTGNDWGSSSLLTIPYDSATMKNWHFDIIHANDRYEMVMSAFEVGTSRNEMSLYYSSSDDGKIWSCPTTIMGPTRGRLTWDNRGIYRSSLLFDDGLYYLFYTGIGKNEHRGIGIAYGEDPEHLVGYQNLESYILDNMKAFNMVNDAYLRNYALKLTSPRSDGTVWEGVLGLHDEDTMKLSKSGKGDEADTISLMMKAAKIYDAIYFLNSNASISSDRITFDGNGSCVSAEIGEFDTLRLRTTAGDGARLEASCISFVDGEAPSNPTAGMIRWDDGEKRLRYYDGESWHSIG